MPLELQIYLLKKSSKNINELIIVRIAKCVEVFLSFAHSGSGDPIGLYLLLFQFLPVPPGGLDGTGSGSTE